MVNVTLTLTERQVALLTRVAGSSRQTLPQWLSALASDLAKGHEREFARQELAAQREAGIAGVDEASLADQWLAR